MKYYHWLFTAAVLVLAGCSNSEETTAVTSHHSALSNDVSSMSLERVSSLNSGSPADASCSLMGGTMALSRQLNGASVGTCQLANGKRCDEQSLINGSCPAG